MQLSSFFIVSPLLAPTQITIFHVTAMSQQADTRQYRMTFPKPDEHTINHIVLAITPWRPAKRLRFPLVHDVPVASGNAVRNTSVERGASSLSTALP
jgi:hypothetical protein